MRWTIHPGTSIDVSFLAQTARLNSTSGSSIAVDDHRLPVVPHLALRAHFSRKFQIGAFAAEVRAGGALYRRDPPQLRPCSRSPDWGLSDVRHRAGPFPRRLVPRNLWRKPRKQHRRQLRVRQSLSHFVRTAADSAAPPYGGFSTVPPLLRGSRTAARRVPRRLCLDGNDFLDRDHAGKLVVSEPAVSVVITAYNRERVIAEAMRSILCQTVADFELIIVDDGSTDATATIVKSFGDARVRLVRHGSNRGIPAARNSGLDAARGQFIAWLDSDDVARPRRLETQLQFLRDHPEIAMVGACAGKIDEQGQPFGPVRRPPFSHEHIRAWLLFRSAFQQSSIFGRAAVLKRFPYRPEFPVCEDIDVFIRLSREHRLHNLAERSPRRPAHPYRPVRPHPHGPCSRAKNGASIGALSDGRRVEGLPEDLERHITLGSGSSQSVGLDARFPRVGRSVARKTGSGQRRQRDLRTQRPELRRRLFLDCRMPPYRPLAMGSARAGPPLLIVHDRGVVHPNSGEVARPGGASLALMIRLSCIEMGECQ